MYPPRDDVSPVRTVLRPDHPLPNGGYVQFPSTNGGWFTFKDKPTLADCVQWVLVGGGYVLTVDFPFTGKAILTLPYPTTIPDVDAQSLAIMHGTPSGWVNITTGVNTGAHTVTGETSSFSDFGVFAPDAEPPEPISTPASSAWSLALLAVIGLGAVPVIRRLKASA